MNSQSEIDCAGYMEAVLGISNNQGSLLHCQCVPCRLKPGADVETLGW